MVEGIRRIVCKRTDSRMIIFISESSRDQLKTIFQPKILRFFANYFLKSFAATHCDLNAYHHVENQIPILITDENHVPLSIFDTFMNIFGCTLILGPFKLRFFLKLLFDDLVDIFGLLYNLVYFFFNELEFFL